MTYIYFFIQESLQQLTYVLIVVYIFTSANIYFFEAKLISNGDVISYSYLTTIDKILKCIAIFINIVLYDMKIDGALLSIIFSNIMCSIILKIL